MSNSNIALSNVSTKRRLRSAKMMLQLAEIEAENASFEAARYSRALSQAERRIALANDSKREITARIAELTELVAKEVS